MAKKGMIEREKKRAANVARLAEKRATLKAQAKDMNLAPEERFLAQLKLAKLPRSSSKVRMHNRCLLTGRPHGYYRRLGMSRIALRELGSAGKIPGMTKSSW